MRFFIDQSLIVLTLAVGLSVSASAGFVYDEDTNGDLSDDGFAPTDLVVGPFDNYLTGHVGGDDLTRHDFFRVSVPGDWTLDAIIVTSYPATDNTTFLGLENADVFNTAPGNLYYYGYTTIGTSDIGQDVLTAMGASNGNFTPPLTAGDYTFWLDESGPDEHYGLMLVLTAPAGDVNCDGVVDLFDVDAFVLALTSAPQAEPYASYNSAFPSCNPMLADMDGNGVVDLFDIDPFVAAIGVN